MSSNRKQRIHDLLKGIESGDPASVSVVNEDKYIQHNPQTQEGSEGLAELFKRLSKTSPRVNIVRIFEDGDFIFAHTEYDFATRNIGFEIFRFEDNQAVEHWDNIQSRMGPNFSGHSMVDGATETTDHDLTETNRAIIKSFVDEILLKNLTENISLYIEQDNYIEHNPELDDNSVTLVHRLARAENPEKATVNYIQSHRILAEGNFVLSVCEGYKNNVSTSFFDLYRLDKGKIVEHWDTSEVIPPHSEWKNENGKF